MRAALLALLVVGAVLGCAVGPNYVEPEAPTPDLWQQQLTRGLAEGEADLQTWWTVFEDPTLTSLIDRAVEQNLDLRLALEQVAEARAERGFARGSWFPSVFNLGSYQRTQLSEESFGGDSPIIGGIPGIGSPIDAWRFGFDATWEIDVFGRVRRLVESANADLEASVEDYRDALVILLADVALTYTQLRTAQQRLAFARSNVEIQRGSLQLTRDRNRAGLAPDLDVRQAEFILYETEASIPLFQQEARFAIHRLSRLLGRPPGDLAAELIEAQPIPSPPEKVLVGIPKNLVRQRPDVRAAERNIAAQSAQIGVAKADLFPRLALIGSFAFDALEAAKLFTGGAKAFSFGPAIRWNLFDGGRVRARIQTEDVRTEQTVTIYENTVLLALEETENAMVAYQREQQRRDSLARSVVANQQALGLVLTLYRTGLTNFQNVLDTQRSLTLAQDGLAESEGLVTGNLIRLYRALGGGWSVN
ncbi:MAG: efflux transporter outer membrane subunit [Myxococcota bacterium]